MVKETEEHFDVILQFLCELVLRNHSITLLPEQSLSSEKLSLVSSHTRTTRGKSSQSFVMIRLCGIVETAINSLSSQSEIYSHDHLWASLLCLSYYRYTVTVQIIIFCINSLSALHLFHYPITCRGFSLFSSKLVLLMTIIIIIIVFI